MHQHKRSFLGWLDLDVQEASHSTEIKVRACVTVNNCVHAYMYNTGITCACIVCGILIWCSTQCYSPCMIEHTFILTQLLKPDSAVAMLTLPGYSAGYIHVVCVVHENEQGSGWRKIRMLRIVQTVRWFNKHRLK